MAKRNRPLIVAKGSANKKHPAVIPAQAGIHRLALRLSRYFISKQLPNLTFANLTSANLTSQSQGVESNKIV
jgi:uncharacterized protein YdhG (YjbR/CyaY superfamily)